MKIKLFALLLITGLTAALTGCVSTVDGRSEAGIPFLKDKVEGRYPVSVAEVFKASRRVLEKNGVLVAENTINNSLEAKVDQASVFVRVDEVDPAKPVSQVTVQVRTRGGSSDIDLAHDIDKQIALELSH